VEGRLTPVLGLTKMELVDPRRFLPVLNTDLDIIDQAIGSIAGGGMSNPMTSPQDLIVGGPSGLPTRLGVGTVGQVLTVVGGVLTWAAPAGGTPSGPAGGDLTGNYPNPQILAGAIVDGDVAPANKDGTAAVPSLRTLGTGAQQAAAGDHAHPSTSTFYYRFSTNTTMADPGAGQFRVDAAVFTTSTAMAIDTVTDNGTDITNVLSSLLAGDMLYVQTQASSANWARHRITGTPINQGGWFRIPVEHVSSGGTLPSNNTPCVIQATLGSAGGGGGMTNPMTSTGDLIAGGAAGAPQRLGIGPVETVLTVVGSAPTFHAWAPAPAKTTQLTNSGLEQWQRSAGPFTAGGAYTADRWQIVLGTGSTVSVARDAANADAVTGSRYCLAAAYTHAAGQPSRVRQTVEQVALLARQDAVFTARVKTSTAASARLALWDDVNGWRYSSYHTGAGGYETLRVTGVVATAAAAMEVALSLEASCTAYLDSAVLTMGQWAPPFHPLHPADDLARCQRYYEVLGADSSGERLGLGQAFSATGAAVPLPFAVKKAVTPTVTVSAPGDFALWNAAGTLVAVTALSATAITTRSCHLSATVASGLAAGDAALFLANSAAARLAIEANPP